jgi:hypothetical protein
MQQLNYQSVKWEQDDLQPDDLMPGSLLLFQNPLLFSPKKFTDNKKNGFDKVKALKKSLTSHYHVVLMVDGDWVLLLPLSSGTSNKSFWGLQSEPLECWLPAPYDLGKPTQVCPNLMQWVKKDSLLELKSSQISYLTFLEDEDWTEICSSVKHQLQVLSPCNAEKKWYWNHFSEMLKYPGLENPWKPSWWNHFYLLDGLSDAQKWEMICSWGA